MTTDIAAIPQSSLNAFLFADIGTEANGMTLSVLSILARFDLDPWQEAGRLAGLSRTKSIEALASLIKALPNSQWSLADAVPIATRLVALLPAGAGRPDAALVWPLRSPGPRADGQDGGTGLRLTGRQWLGMAVVVCALFAGLAASVLASLPAGNAVQHTASQGPPPAP